VPFVVPARLLGRLTAYIPPMRSGILVLALLAGTVIGPRAEAQILALHGVFVPGSDERRSSTGIEAELGGIVSTRYAPLWPSLAVEYQRQQDLGPTRARVAGQLRVLLRSNGSRVLPYVGVSVSANQSGGDQPEWEGTRGGIQGMGGFLLKPGDNFHLALLLEERFGYVREQNHALATHVGLALSF
jgi:hypothetical protein